MSQDQDQLRPSQYDGIQEYDNQLPKWWLFTFYLTIVVAFVYWTRFYVIEADNTQKAELASQQKAFAEKYADLATSSVAPEQLLAMAKDPREVQSGAAVYKTYCTPCHGQLGEGGIGPNLTDNYWIHGNKPDQIVAVIAQGVPAKGMTPWKGILSPSQISQVAAYVISTEGSNPPNPKEPQGEPAPKNL